MSSMHEVQSEGESQYSEWLSEMIDAASDLGVEVPDDLTALSDLSEAVDMTIASTTDADRVAALKRLRDRWSA